MSDPTSWDYLQLAEAAEEAPRFSRRRRLLIWGGVAVAFFGSVLILHLARREKEADLRRLVAIAARGQGLDAALVAAVVHAESKGNPTAVSRAQAYGLMQLRIPTASEVAGRPVTVDELFDPAFNLDLGCRYLRRMLDRFDDNVLLALMAYNAGPGRVERWLNEERDPVAILKHHAYGETRAYVGKVLRHARGD
ncbi:MAG: lytic transglycosylase domain-containing protein [Planctomycetota bacterium]|jgi:soluble lytic murein transglycosylase-like protein